MKYLFLMLGVAGLAVLFGLSDPAPAASELVTPEDVQMVSEEVSEPLLIDNANRCGRTVGGSGRKNGKRGKF